MAESNANGYNGSSQNEQNYDSVLKSVRESKNKSNRSILVVDDEATFRKMIAKTIQQSDPEVAVYEAGNGREGLQKLEEIQENTNTLPTFITVDLYMPVMDGWEMIEELRKYSEQQGWRQGIPVIVFSATTGKKGFAFLGKDVHGGKMKYEPLVTVAKENCMKFQRYDAIGEKGLEAWIAFFIRNNLTE